MKEGIAFATRTKHISMRTLPYSWTVPEALLHGAVSDNGSVYSALCPLKKYISLLHHSNVMYSIDVYRGTRTVLHLCCATMHTIEHCYHRSCTYCLVVLRGWYFFSLPFDSSSPFYDK